MNILADIRNVAAGDILLFYRPRGLGALVSLLTRSPYYHVALAIDSTRVVEALANGVVQSDIDSKSGEPFLVLPGPDKASAPRAVSWAKSKIGDGYDPKDLLAIALERTFKNLQIHFVTGDRYTCGEFVAMAFTNAGLVLFPDLHPEEVIPADFARFLPDEEGAGSIGERRL